MKHELTHTDIMNKWTRYDRKTKISDLKDYILEQRVNDKWVALSIGTDSKYKGLRGKSKRNPDGPQEWSCKYITTICFSWNGGGKGQGLILREESIFGNKPLAMFDRLWREVVMSVDLALWILQETGLYVEIHFDVNPKQEYKSNILFESALGYAKSFGFAAKCKPEGVTASHASDHFIKKDAEMKHKHRKGKRKTKEISISL
jgi:predicted RNase H-related nuclease YkuK (DUF458 family)